VADWRNSLGVVARLMRAAYTRVTTFVSKGTAKNRREPRSIRIFEIQLDNSDNFSDSPVVRCCPKLKKVLDFIGGAERDRTADLLS
jgi:hypothetical protein